MRQVWITHAGSPEVLQVREAPDPTPRPGQVRIRVEAAGVNFADVMVRLGLYRDAPPLPTVVGYEVAGMIDAVGEGVDRARLGHAVVAYTHFGGYSDVTCVDSIQVFTRPAEMSALEGAALLVNYLTAHQCLVVMGSLQPGDLVLVHNAGGGVGLAAIDICKLHGATIIGTASASKHAFLRERGVHELIDYRTRDFEAEVKRVTDGRGVQLVLDPLGPSSWRKSYRLLSPAGRLVIYGISEIARGKKMSPLTATLRLAWRMPWLKFNPVRLFNDNKAVVGVNLGRLWGEREMTRGWIEKLLEWHKQGRIQPHIDSVFDFAHAADAHRRLQDRKNVGKVVLVP
jgi:NADPH:quinone reductase-like Zn-dependent oxidoreductase